MKKLIVLLLSFTIVTSSCHRERALGWSGDVDALLEGMTYGEPPHAAYIEAALAGQLFLQSDPSYGYCILPEHSEIPMFNRLSITGELSSFGRLDVSGSYVEHEECRLIPEAGIISAMALGTLVNDNGDALFYYGDAVCQEDGQYDGKFCISGGTGAFTDATGWISLDMILSPLANSWKARLEGQILLSRG